MNESSLDRNSDVSKSSLELLKVFLFPLQLPWFPVYRLSTQNEVPDDNPPEDND